ncbi:hypothetical protein, partial [Flavitalea sp.]|nr:hypothetical protein [Flavitalea sp.]
SLIRQLNSSPLTEENFENCLNEGDKVMHDLLLDLVSRDKFRLSRLAEKGANIKIRNRASQLLKKKNYR